MKTNNNFEIITCKNVYVHSISFALILPIGSINDPIGKQGITHLIEHLCFRRAGTLSQKELYTRCEEFGVDIKASTGKEYIKFSFICRTDVFLEVLDIFHKMFSEINYNENELKCEKNVILAEINEKYIANSDEIINSLWGKESFKNSILGTEKSLKNITLNDIKKHKQELLNVNGMIFVLGNFNESHILKIQDLFPNDGMNIKNKKLTTKADINDKAKIHFMREKQDFCDIYYAFKIDISDTVWVRKFISMQMLDSILFQGNAAYMNEIIREEKGYIYSFFSEIDFIENELVYLFNFVQRKENLQNALKAIENHLVNFTAEDKYLRYIKAFFCDNIELLYDNQESLLQEYTRNYISYKEAIEPVLVAEIIKDIKQYEYEETLKSLLKNKNIYIFGNLNKSERNQMKEICK